CRADAAKDKRGVCGITADGMAMRMMLLRNVMGASTYQYHAAATIRTLRKTAEGKAPYSICEPEKLMGFATRLGVATTGSDKDIALRLCDYLEKEWHLSGYEESAVVKALAPEERQNLWRSLDIFPGGIYSEMMMATSSSLTNVDGYYVSLAKKAMRMSIAMAYQSQIVLEYLQDVMFGIPRPHIFRTDLGVLDPEYVNILPNGHEPFLGFALVITARDPVWQEKARKAGAKGIRIIANIETGQEMIQRWEMDDVFYGYTGNWIMQEAILATGAVDVFVADMN
ncbi:MAG TPA: carbon monoxide dehydrogenase, partial [Methanospirillum sp.]|nr:carbon monoxide dehydrogenase [Methanospirillum sp.]